MSIQQYEPPAPDTAPVVHSAQVTDLVAWAAQSDAAFRYASAIVGTNFCPQQYRGKAEEAAAAILAGSELGFSPMASLRTFDNIQGVASPKAITQRAVVQSHGHAIWTEESSATRVVVCGQRKGSEKVIRSVWTIERAKLAGYLEKNAKYKTEPESMLVARATSECARQTASDALLGIPYSSEELRDDAALSEPHPDERRALPSPRAAQRGGTSVSVADLTGDTSIDAAPSIDREQWTAIVGHFKAANVAAADRGTIVDWLVGREVGGMTNLTHDEAGALEKRLGELGPDGIAGAVEPEVVEAEDDEQYTTADVDPANDPWASEADS